LLAVGWIALLAAGDAFLTQRALEESRSAAGSADYREAATRAGDAIALQPWAADPRLQLALVNEAAGDLAQAREEAAEATGKAPDDWLVWLARARIEARSGRVAAASAALQQARRLNPRAPIFAQPAPPQPSP
jgi:Tfp pilus assembly protein PilF